jgi:AmmeMemoRadiSam system protein A
MALGDLTEADEEVIARFARRAVEYAVREGRSLEVDSRELPAVLAADAACFVTLKKDGELRGCIGSLEAHRSLAKDIADNAWAATRRDPRFTPVVPSELPRIRVSVSVLTPSEPLSFRDEEDLLSRLRPGVDGLLLTHARGRGTFLPEVWAELPDPWLFLAHLKHKAGLPPDHSLRGVAVSRYRSHHIAAGGLSDCKVAPRVKTKAHRV